MQTSGGWLVIRHEDMETTMIYTHQIQENLKRSIGKIDNK